MMPTPPTKEPLRPQLSSSMPESEFLAWYWLKVELAEFCRVNGLRTVGSKEDLTARIAAHLGGRGEPAKAHDGVRSPRDTTPERLTLETVVVPGFRLSRKLRAFFDEHAGAGFHFNQALRDFFRDPAGRTLADALALYQRSQNEPAAPIAAQFEYNRHMREFHADRMRQGHQRPHRCQVTART